MATPRFTFNLITGYYRLAKLTHKTNFTVPILVELIFNKAVRNFFLNILNIPPRW